MKFKNSIRLIITCLLFQTPATFAETTIEELYLGQGGDLNCGQGNAVASIGDVIYTTWIDGTNLMAAVIYEDGVLDEIVVRENIQNDKYHVMPSIAIDKQGYIHLTADTHNQDWIYYISKRPLNISKGFIQQIPGEKRCPPGKNITYPQFFTDTNGVLYLSYRSYITSATGSTAGNPAGALARYQHRKRQWKVIGGSDALNYPSGNGDEDATLVWNPTGAFGGWYQQPNLKLFFDASNRMHVIATVANTSSNRTWNGMTHLIYAYSDDRGNSFHRIDGTLIDSLPLTIENATVVVDRSTEADLWTGSNLLQLGAFASNQPVISYHIDGIGYIKKWNGSDWIELNVPKVADGIYTRRNGHGVVFRPYFGLYFTADGGENFEPIAHGIDYNAGSPKVDLNHYIHTGDFRWQAVHNEASEMRIYSMDFINDEEFSSTEKWLERLAKKATQKAGILSSQLSKENIHTENNTSEMPPSSNNFLVN